jgi:hypothetical protein
MNRLYCHLVILVVLVNEGIARDPSWFAERMKVIDSIHELPQDERFLKLGELAAIGHRPPLDHEQETVFKAAQRTLLSIPGHAEFFANKIRADDILRETGRGHEVKGGVLWDFETLGQLPSPETVKVLGSFLDDERHRVEVDPNSDVAPIAANNLLAARALHSLKIASPPLHKRPGSYDDIQPWRLWFAQVEAGKRTFRFEGDPQHYSLAGPVAEPRLPRDRPAAGPESQDPPSQQVDRKGRAIPVMPLIAAGLLLFSAAWLATRKKAPAE